MRSRLSSRCGATAAASLLLATCSVVTGEASVDPQAASAAPLRAGSSRKAPCSSKHRFPIYFSDEGAGEIEDLAVSFGEAAQDVSISVAAYDASAGSVGPASAIYFATVQPYESYAIDLQPFVRNKDEAVVVSVSGRFHGGFGTRNQIFSLPGSSARQLKPRRGPAGPQRAGDADFHPLYTEESRSAP